MAAMATTAVGEHAAALRRFLAQAKGRTVVVTGAGVSTDSGIPDYRGPNGVYVRNMGAKPIQYELFVRDAAYQQAYWARSFLSWPGLSAAPPSPAHAALTYLQQHGHVARIITQNTDRLHSTSGAADVLELHGTVHEVECVACDWTMPRATLQRQMEALNPVAAQWAKEHPSLDGDISASVNPSGGAAPPWRFDEFQVPDCEHCGHALKPRVVFFGEDLKEDVGRQCEAAVRRAKAMLVVGSSLQVNTAASLVWLAHDRRIPIAILNRGPTDADDICDLRIEHGCSEVLAALVASVSTDSKPTKKTRLEKQDNDDK